MSNTKKRNNAADSGLPIRALLGIAGMIAMGGTRIGETEDDDAKGQAYDEWILGKWEAIHAKDLQPGDKMRDAAGGALEITGAFMAAEDTVYVQAGSLSMHIPNRGVVLILPNVRGMARRGEA